MKDLPEKFQFRLSGERYAGYTHTAKRNAHGDYEIEWARGWHKKVGHIEWVVANDAEVKDWVRDGGWVIVDDKPKQDNSASTLPDEFYFNHTVYHKDTLYKATWNGCVYDISWNGQNHSSNYTKEQVTKWVSIGDWKILEKKPLTPEQQKQLKEFREQIEQLDSSIKLNEQDIEHKNRMIANYKGRQDDLRKKIEEIEGRA